MLESRLRSCRSGPGMNYDARFNNDYKQLYHVIKVVINGKGHADINRFTKKMIIDIYDTGKYKETLFAGSGA